MLYVPREKGMWDTWMFYHEGIFHLYYLQSIGEALWVRVGHATSSDFLHWTEQEPALHTGQDGSWDCWPIGVGQVFRAKGKFFMTYCGLKENVPQKIGLAFSEDLFHWEKCPQNPVLVPAMGGTLYESDPDQVFNRCPSWRDAFVSYDNDDGLFHALIAGRLLKGPYVRRGCVAHAVSKDLIGWDILPPIYAPRKYHDHELPELHKIGEKYYLLWTTLFYYHNHHGTRSRGCCSGVRYAVSEKPYEGFSEPDDNLLVGSGGTRFDNCAGRIIAVQDTYLLYYEMVQNEYADHVSLASPKTVRVTSDGQLVPGYCNRMDGLKKKELVSGIRSEWINQKNSVEGEEWVANDGVLSADVDGSFLLATNVNLSDFMLECEIAIEGGFFAGIGVVDDKGGPVSSVCGAAVLDNRSQQIHVLGNAKGKTGPVLAPLDSSCFPVQSNKSYHLRMLVRGPWTDIFFDDCLYFSLALPWPERGRLAFMACDVKACFKNLKVDSL
ncbi:MAG: hypothetical protein L6437_09820 [Kiritimatiellae bacterium]|nr:hypothetical protein [Kiritimatiellia bacterium]